MRVVLVAAALVMVAACDNVDGRACTTTSECGDPSVWACAYPISIRGPVCPPGERGTCTRLTTCAARDLSGRTGDPASEGCTCEGTMGGVYGACGYAPMLGAGVAPCDCAFHTELVRLPSDQVHAGPRGPREYCRTDTWTVPTCCDCSLAILGASDCVAMQAHFGEFPLPAACCVCVTPSSPDPTGRCAPPGGVFPPAGRWCCPIQDDPDAGATPDGGP